MAKQKPVERVEISTFVHATEDRGKVIKAVSKILPMEMELPHLEEVQLEGQFRDPILMLKWVFKKTQPATETINNVIQSIPIIDRQELMDTLASRIDDSKNLYLRLDKQKAFTGVVKLGLNDPIRIKARMRVPRKKDPIKHLYDYFQELTRNT